MGLNPERCMPRPTSPYPDPEIRKKERVVELKKKIEELQDMVKELEKKP
jgi:hypothetical protein